MRVPIAGGTPQLVLTSRIFNYRCAKSPAKVCVIAELTPEPKQFVFTAFDPLEGRGRELNRFDIGADPAYGWDLSPDGTRSFCGLRGHSRTFLAIHGRSEILEGPKAVKINTPGLRSRGDEDALQGR
jgi:hypothetical protein